jgi:competence protein ComEA
MFRLLSAVSIAGLLLAPAFGQAQTTSPAQKGTRQTPSKPATVVNVNTATAAELTQLPGIGAKTAARIIDYRQKKGPFKKPEELMNVQGIGEKSFLKLKAQISVGNSSDQKSQQN